MEWYLSLAMAAALAVCAGVRAFVPLFVIGVVARMGIFSWVVLNPAFEWVASTPAVVAFGLLGAAEIALDKRGSLGFVADTIYLVLRPAAGVLSVLAVLDLGVAAATLPAAAVLAGSLGLPLNLIKAGAKTKASERAAAYRSLSYSVYEDVLAAGGAVLALVIPAIAFPVDFGCAFWLMMRQRAEIVYRAQQERDRLAEQGITIPENRMMR